MAVALVVRSALPPSPCGRDTARVMSQENVERIRTAFAGTTAGDFSFLPSIIDDNCEFLLPPNFPGTQETRGPQGFLSVVKEVEEAFEDIRYEPEEFLDQGDRLFAAVRTVGHAKHTGLAVDLLVYWVYTFRQEKVVKMEAYLDRIEALEAVGPSE
jgi:ketosteroid isomerase-like protein